MIRYRLLFVIAAIACLFTACQDDEIVSSRPAEVGEEICFGARAGFEHANPSSRTAYTGDTYDVDGVTLERINWVSETDKIHIYSPQANNNENAHYTVIRKESATDSHEDYATLERAGDSSLQWGSTDEHTFYAMYPSYKMFWTKYDQPIMNAKYVELIGIKNDGTMNCFIHNHQVTEGVVKEGNRYIVKPDMRYAYMASKTTAMPTDENINISFKPIVTAIELTLSMPENAKNKITIANVTLSGNNISGAYNYNIDTDEIVEEEVPIVGNSGNIVFNTNIVGTDITYGQQRLPLTLVAGESLTLTLFLKPNADLNTPLKVTVRSDMGIEYEGSRKSKTFPNNLEIKAKKKNIITGMHLQSEDEEVPLTINYDRWIEQLQANTKIKDLSLPGTEGSFSGNMNSDNKYKTQDVKFIEQWKLGIRAFEVSSDRNVSASQDLGEQEVIIGDQHIVYENSSLTINEVFNILLNTLDEKPMETAMLILTYQPQGGYLAPERNGTSYMKQLNDYINKKFSGVAYKTGEKAYNADDIILFDPDLALGEYAENEVTIDEDGKISVSEGAVSTGARGKLMIVVRPNQQDWEDYTIADNGWFDTTTTDNVEIWNAIKKQISGTALDKLLVINGCGTARDKWGARGYKLQAGDNEAKFLPNISNNFGAGEYLEYFMNTTNPIFGTYDTNAENFIFNTTYNDTEYTITRAARSQPAELNFGYATSHDDITCWYQEWSRVLDTDIKTNYIHWFESYNEKLSNAKTTFYMSISGSYPHYTFINSLGGYLVDNSSTGTTISPSVGNNYGGSYGNIRGLAKKLNQDFYIFATETHHLSKASTGIVLINFIRNEIIEGEEASYWLPQIIIGNNRSLFNIETTKE